MAQAVGDSDRLQIAKVRADLAIAHGYYERVAEGVGRSVEGLAGSARLARVLDQSARERNGATAELLATARVGMKLDFLYFLHVDRDNRDLTRNTARPAAPDPGQRAATLAVA